MEDSIGNNSIDPSLLQVSLEQPSGGDKRDPRHHVSGKSSPSRGRCVKEYEEQLQQLQHENFNLKLRVFLLEERMGKALGRGDAAEIIKDNIELKVENETVKKSLVDKNKLLAQASNAIGELEAQQRLFQVDYKTEKEGLNQQIESLRKEVSDLKEMQLLQATQRAMSCGNPMARSVDESVDLYAQAFGSLVLSLHCNYPDHHSNQEVEELNSKIAELNDCVRDLRSEATVSAMEFQLSQSQTMSFRQNIEQLQNEVAEKNRRIDSLVQQLEMQAPIDVVKGETGFLNHNNNINRKSDSSAVKELVERDKIIEEKHNQLEQQKKILADIQITLDEKQKQIAELEDALCERKKKADELESSLSKAGRTLQGFVTDVQSKERELELLKNDAKKKDKRVKDLTAELKEANEMLNKAKWEAETSGRVDSVKTMAEEENERLWTELEDKKRMLEAAERERNQLKLDGDQLRVTLSSKDEAISQADLRGAAILVETQELKRKIQLLEEQLSNLSSSRSAKPSDVAAAYSTTGAMTADLINGKDQEIPQLHLLLSNLASQQHSTFSSPQEQNRDQLQAEESSQKLLSLESRTDYVEADLEVLKSKETHPHGGQEQQYQLGLYKREVTGLRKRLADSTNACDVLRTRLEEMADFLEEILSLGEYGMLNLSNWSARRRQTLQHSILQSRELSRSLSQSLMIGVDVGAPGQHSVCSSVSVSSWSAREHNSTIGPEQLDSSHENMQPHLLHDAASPGETMDVHELRSTVARLEEQVKQRDAEIAWLHRQYVKTNQEPTCDKSAPIEAEKVHPNSPPVNSTASSFIKPIQTDGQSPDEQNKVINCHIATLDDTVKAPTAGVAAVFTTALDSKSERSRQSLPEVSESEAWSEPDRNVSFARIGLAAHDQSLSVRKPRSLSAPGVDEESVATSESPDGNISSVSGDASKARRSHSDARQIKKMQNQVRLLDEGNKSLRLQLSTVVSSLRGSWSMVRHLDESSASQKFLDPLDERSQVLRSASSPQETPDLGESVSCTRINRIAEGFPNLQEVEGSCGNPAVIAQHIIDALNTYLLKTKESLRCKEERLHASRDIITQLEFKITSSSENEAKLEEQLRQKNQTLAQLEQNVVSLERRCVEVDRNCQLKLAEKELIITQLERHGHSRESQFRNNEAKLHQLEKSLTENQDLLRAMESRLLTQQQSNVAAKAELEVEIHSLLADRNRLQSVVDDLRDRLAIQVQKPCGTATSSIKALQKQLSNVSDYVSDQAADSADCNSHRSGSKSAEIEAEVVESRRNSNRPTLQFPDRSPDLGIDSDPSRFSSLESQTPTENGLRTAERVDGATWTKRASASTVESLPGGSPATGEPCLSCQLLHQKYTKAKQTLVVTMEKLKAANIRKEKVDRALNKELGKTHSVLCQARGLLEQANQSAKNQP